MVLKSSGVCPGCDSFRQQSGIDNGCLLRGVDGGSLPFMSWFWTSKLGDTDDRSLKLSLRAKLKLFRCMTVPSSSLVTWVV